MVVVIYDTLFYPTLLYIPAKTVRSNNKDYGAVEVLALLDASSTKAECLAQLRKLV